MRKLLFQQQLRDTQPSSMLMVKNLGAELQVILRETQFQSPQGRIPEQTLMPPVHGLILPDEANENS